MIYEKAAYPAGSLALFQQRPNKGTTIRHDQEYESEGKESRGEAIGFRGSPVPSLVRESEPIRQMDTHAAGFGRMKLSRASSHEAT
jgi:hypothetical protein